jgi:hypothetical protein
MFHRFPNSLEKVPCVTLARNGNAPQVLTRHGYHKYASRVDRASPYRCVNLASRDCYLFIGRASLKLPRRHVADPARRLQIYAARC